MHTQKRDEMHSLYATLPFSDFLSCFQAKRKVSLRLISEYELNEN